MTEQLSSGSSDSKIIRDAITDYQESGIQFTAQQLAYMEKKIKRDQLASDDEKNDLLETIGTLNVEDGQISAADLRNRHRFEEFATRIGDTEFEPGDSGTMTRKILDEHRLGNFKFPETAGLLAEVLRYGDAEEVGEALTTYSREQQDSAIQ